MSASSRGEISTSSTRTCIQADSRRQRLLPARVVAREVWPNRPEPGGVPRPCSSREYRSRSSGAEQRGLVRSRRVDSARPRGNSPCGQLVLLEQEHVRPPRWAGVGDAAARSPRRRRSQHGRGWAPPPAGFRVDRHNLHVQVVLTWRYASMSRAEPGSQWAAHAPEVRALPPTATLLGPAPPLRGPAPHPPRSRPTPHRPNREPLCTISPLSRAWCAQTDEPPWDKHGGGNVRTVPARRPPPRRSAGE